ncbi:MAG: hypothetical protein GY953_30840 [bacterium]|nr:hypothetical protein [bacterium]
MESVISSLGELLLQALPTFILLLLLHFYLKWAFYRPMDRLLKKRWEATEGARKAADKSLTNAQQKADAYEEAIRDARAELYKEHEELRRRREQQQAAAFEEARRKTGVMVREAKAELASEAEAARQSLRAETEALASEIAGAVLEGRPV